MTLFKFADITHVSEVEPVVIKEREQLMIRSPNLEAGIGNKEWNHIINKAQLGNRDSLPVRQWGYSQNTASIPMSEWLIGSQYYWDCSAVVFVFMD